MVKGKP